MHGCSIWAQREPLDICYFFHLFHCHLPEQREKCFSLIFFNQFVRTFWPMLRTTSSRPISLSKTNLIGKIAKNDWNKIFTQALHCDCGTMHPGQLSAVVVFLPLPLTGPLHIFNFVTFGLCGMKLKKYPLKCKTKLSEKYDVRFDCWKRKTKLTYNCAHLRWTNKKNRNKLSQNGPRDWTLILDKKWFDQFFAISDHFGQKTIFGQNLFNSKKWCQKNDLTNFLAISVHFWNNLFCQIFYYWNDVSASNRVENRPIRT